MRFYLRLYPQHDMPTLVAWREKFVHTRIAPRISQAARALVYSHRNDLVVIITATNRFLTEPIAAALGVEHLIATEPPAARVVHCPTTRVVEFCFANQCTHELVRSARSQPPATQGEEPL